MIADYRYTFTSGPIGGILANDNVSGNALVPIEIDDFMTIVINTTAAPMTQLLDHPSGQAPIGSFLEATSIQMSLGSFYLDTRTAVGSSYRSFFISEYDTNGLPTSWMLNFVEEPYIDQPPGNSYELIQLNSTGVDDEVHNSIYADSNTPDHLYYVVANAIGSGQWTLEQISSPVPEVEPYALLVAGLGFIWFVRRRRGYF